MFFNVFFLTKMGKEMGITKKNSYEEYMQHTKHIKDIYQYPKEDIIINKTEIKTKNHKLEIK